MSQAPEVEGQIGDYQGRNFATHLYEGHSNTEMDVIGVLIFLGVMVVALPLLPFIALAWIVNRFL